MSKPSGKSIQRRNDVRCQVKVSVNHDIAADFKAACVQQGVSMASVLTRFMAGYCNTQEKPKPDNPKSETPLNTRKQRRAFVNAVITHMNKLLAAEERFYASVPENLQGSQWHEASETSIATIQEVIDLLIGVYE